MNGMVTLLNHMLPSHKVKAKSYVKLCHCFHYYTRIVIEMCICQQSLVIKIHYHIYNLNVLYCHRVKWGKWYGIMIICYFTLFQNWNERFVNKFQINNWLSSFDSCVYSLIYKEITAIVWRWNSMSYIDKRTSD